MSVYLGVQVPGFGLYRDAATPFQYPGGEWHLKDILPCNLTPSGSVWLARVNGADVNDLVLAALFAQVAHSRQQPFVLLLPYLPAARSDRGEPTGAIVYADLVKSMNPQQVIGIDPHSDKIELFLGPKLTSIPPTALIERVLRETGDTYDAVIAPDHGAVPRARAVADALMVPLVIADKKRDFETGKIEGITIDGVEPDKRYLVVDDICDGGGTFRGLAAATELERDRLGLWVTHGIFSGVAHELKKDYAHIYTTDSHPGHGSLAVKATVVPAEAIMFQHIKETFL